LISSSSPSQPRQSQTLHTNIPPGWIQQLLSTLPTCTHRPPDKPRPSKAQSSPEFTPPPVCLSDPDSSSSTSFQDPACQRCHDVLWLVLGRGHSRPCPSFSTRAAVSTVPRIPESSSPVVSPDHADRLSHASSIGFLQLPCVFLAWLRPLKHLAMPPAAPPPADAIAAVRRPLASPIHPSSAPRAASHLPAVVPSLSRGGHSTQPDSLTKPPVPKCLNPLQ